MHLNGSERWCLYRIGKLDMGMTCQHFHTFHHRVAWWWHERAYELRDSFPAGDLVTPPYLLHHFIIGYRKDFRRYPTWSIIRFKAYGLDVFLPFHSCDEYTRTIISPCFPCYMWRLDSLLHILDFHDILLISHAIHTTDIRFWVRWCCYEDDLFCRYVTNGIRKII